jgi:hypothetical protein
MLFEKIGGRNATLHSSSVTDNMTLTRRLDATMEI